jgi:hypothetical protein
MVEQVWPLGRSGQTWRPFCERYRVQAQGCSGRMQRALADFGVDEFSGLKLGFAPRLGVSP